MPLTSRIRLVLLAGSISATVAGCSDAPEIRTYTVASENKRDLTSELLRSQFPGIPFDWDVPKSWQLASNDQFSTRAWSTGPVDDPARITLGQFPARTGIPAQVLRWRRQLGLETVSQEEAMQDVRSLKTQNGAGSFASLDGPKETILAFIIPVGTQFWIFRYKSSRTTAESESDRFRRFCKSLRYVAPEASGKLTDTDQSKIRTPASITTGPADDSALAPVVEPHDSETATPGTEESDTTATETTATAAEKSADEEEDAPAAADSSDEEQ